MTLPDSPRWVEANGIAGDPAHWRAELGRGGYALGHDAAKLIVIVGEPEAKALAALVVRHPQHVLLLENPAKAPRPAQRAILHTLPDPDALPDYEGAVPLPVDAALPASLEVELTWARTRATIWTAYVDGAPACFAYAPWRSAALFDVSVDTLPSARQLGLATITAAAMIRDERAQGREPVWGADEGNAASLRLAARLGFVATDEIWVCAP
ncbi:MAG TPA: GNAT family N-acetyltransferase [Kofleriaceae bacterium]|nr:GNAT family N-acetyltransferase [Kofleriaceae bacterium]